MRLDSGASRKPLKPEIFLPNVFQPQANQEEAFSRFASRIFSPRGEEAEVLSTPIDWECGSRLSDRNWRMLLQGWAFYQTVIPHFDSYSVSQKVTIFRHVHETIIDWMSVYGDDPDDVVTSRMPDSYAWYDMSVGYRALMVAFFTSRGLHSFLDDQDMDSSALDGFVRKHIRHLSSPEVLFRNNHGLFQLHGLAALVNLCEVGEDFADTARYAATEMEDLILSQFSEDGVHLEHSPHYHFYVLDVITNILNSGWYESDYLREIIKGAETHSKWLVDAAGRVVTIGDSLFEKPKNAPQLPTFGRGLVTSSFEKSGYAVVRSGWGCEVDDSAFIFMTGAHHSNVHKHRDCLSFEWHVGGNRLVCDSGRYGYHSDEFRRYALSTRAHNTIEIDGFDVLRMSPTGSMLNPSYVHHGIAHLSGARRYRSFYHAREVVSDPRRWLIIFDEVRQVRYHPVSQWLHFGEKFTTSTLSGSRHVFEGEGSLRLTVETFGTEVSKDLYVADDRTMNGFLFMGDAVVSPGIAMSMRSLDDCPDTTFLTVLSLDEDAHDDAVAYANAYRGSGLT